MAAVAVSTAPSPLKAPAVARGKTEDLYRLVRALSEACASDKNVLKDAALVDLLETQAKQILRSRRARRAPPTISPAENKTAKKLKEIVRSGESQAAESCVKRRKLSLDDKKPETPPFDAPIRCRSPFLFPTTERKHKSAASDELSFASKLDPLDLTPTIRPVAVRPVPVYHMSNANGGNAVDVYQLVGKSPQLTGKAGRCESPAMSDVDVPFKSLDSGAVDLSASMASTTASCVDDLYDEYRVSPDKMRRYTRSPALESRGRSPSEMTSMGSIDWTPSDDDDSELFPELEVDRQQLDVPSIMNEMNELTRVSEGGDRVSTSEVDVNVLDQSSEEESYFSASEEAVERLVVKNPTEVVMEVLYGIMKDNDSFKWLVDPVNQARVAKLVDYHIKEHGASLSSGEHSELIGELRSQVDQLARENSKIQSENAVLLEKASMEVMQQGTFADMAHRLAASEEALTYQQSYRREAEAAFQAELQSKMDLIMELKQTIHLKDDEVSQLLKRAEDITALYGSQTRLGDKSVVQNLRDSVTLREGEVLELKSSLAEKDREICHLYMQLSTKKRLVEEVTAKLLQQLEANQSGKSGFANGRPQVDVDAFLFKNVVNKQQIIDELTAALEVMEREVGGLEARVAAKERETLQMKTKQSNLMRSLSSSQKEVSKVRTENSRLSSAIKANQSRIRDLMTSLEEKDQQVVHLNEQVELRQAQLDQIITELEKYQGTRAGSMASASSA